MSIVQIRDGEPEKTRKTKGYYVIDYENVDMLKCRCVASELDGYFFPLSLSITIRYGQSFHR